MTLKKKKKVYIISHSHLDREWYMPYEQHHMRVVELFDEIIDSFEHDPSFKFFHVDGQTIPLDDYLEVKPENRQLIEKYIAEGRLKIGPFYILQDDFLISSEAHVRNTLVGLEEVEKYHGQPVKLGYFPDTFGNMGQTPQMMKKMGLDAAAFGRGVKPTGFNNATAESYTSQYSEMNWEGPDQTRILGILFANWYSNGNEIPTDEAEAVEFWNKKIAEAEKYASTNHLLMMNGCDHQPLQKDVGKAIELANQLFPDYEFVHSNFDAYLEAVKNDLPKDLGTVTGELTSQETEGWYTLANTASSRMYLKKENVYTQTLLENVVDPLVVLANEVEDYKPTKEMSYAWRLLLQNDPHDSICGCSVDEVHEEMMTRYHKSQEVAKFIRDEALDRIAKNIDTTAFPKESFPFTVYNLAGTKRLLTTQVKIEIDRIKFSEMWPQPAFEELENSPVADFSIIDADGNEIDATIDEVKVEFGYDLPKDAFRVAYMAKYVYATIYLPEAEALSYRTLALIPKKTEHHQEGQSLLSDDGRVLENSFVKVEIKKNGSLTISNKRTGKIYENQLIFEDVGDMGNEYIFKQTADEKAIYSTDFPFCIDIIKDKKTEAIVKLTHFMEIPVSADEVLQKEYEQVIDITHRQAKRAKQVAAFPVTTHLSLKKDSKAVEFTTSFDNQMKDHRLRVLFETDLSVSSHVAESIFEAVERPNAVSAYWKNPTNPQHQHAFVNLHDDENGLTVGNIALNEYEIIDSKTIAVTLLRCVGEMGDWGYFPTPEAQCLGSFEVKYSVEAHGKEDYYGGLQRAVALKIPVVVKQTVPAQKGRLETDKILAKISSDIFVETALKLEKNGQGVILRGYSLDSYVSHPLKLEMMGGKQAKVVNLLEEDEKNYTGRLQAAEILTTLWR
ncbi:MAG: alpha-mannosidase [Streptococcaceae bacterium]|jgi:alpha-mannosidase|nr:alpha-mannosidase [Streptococcaceae bacterium]